jgi:hypothetical protein
MIRPEWRRSSAKGASACRFPRAAARAHAIRSGPARHTSSSTGKRSAGPQVMVCWLIPCLRQIATTVSPDSTARNTRRIASSLCPRFAIPWLSSPPQRTTTGRDLSTSRRLSFWVLGQSGIDQLQEATMLQSPLGRRPSPSGSSCLFGMKSMELFKEHVTGEDKEVQAEAPEIAIKQPRQEVSCRPMAHQQNHAR